MASLLINSLKASSTTINNRGKYNYYSHTNSLIVVFDWLLDLIVLHRTVNNHICEETYSSPKKVQAQLFFERLPLRPKIQNLVFFAHGFLGNKCHISEVFSGSNC